MIRVLRLIACVLGVLSIILGLYAIWARVMGENVFSITEIVFYLFLGLVFGLFGITGEMGMSRGFRKISGDKQGKHESGPGDSSD